MNRRRHLSDEELAERGGVGLHRHHELGRGRKSGGYIETVRAQRHRSLLSTFSFQARPFYEQLGYALIGTLEDYPEGHSLFFMTKRLTP